MNICVIGAGYVGLVTAAAFAEMGNSVVIVEKDKNKLHQLKTGKPPFFEQGLEDSLKTLIGLKRLSFYGDLKCVKHANVIFITVGTPSLPSGEADLSGLISVCTSIGKLMDSYKLVVIKSTVPVGTCDMVKRIILESFATPCNFDVASNPEFLREGTALHDARKPSRIVLGCSGKKGIAILKKIYEPFNAPVVFTDPRSSEMIKYASNAFLATKVSFINEIANICERVGADIKHVAHGMGLDKRIGPDFLRAGIGYGGSCFPKDTKALIQIAGHVAHDFKLLKAVVEVNSLQWRKIVEKLKLAIGEITNKTITIWGLTFKPNTDDIRDAPSIEIINAITNSGGTVKVYDPIISCPRGNSFQDVIFNLDPYEAAAGSDAVILVTEWDVFQNIDLKRLKKALRQPVLIDGRNIYNPEQITAAGFNYYCVGRPLNNNYSLPGDFNKVSYINGNIIAKHA